MEIVEKVEEIIKRLKKLYPEPKLELEFEDAFQLLVMAILAAQESDKKVNKVAKELFKELKKNPTIFWFYRWKSWPKRLNI